MFSARETSFCQFKNGHFDVVQTRAKLQAFRLENHAIERLLGQSSFLIGNKRLSDLVADPHCLSPAKPAVKAKNSSPDQRHLRPLIVSNSRQDSSLKSSVERKRNVSVRDGKIGVQWNDVGLHSGTSSCDFTLFIVEALNELHGQFNRLAQRQVGQETIVFTVFQRHFLNIEQPVECLPVALDESTWLISPFLSLLR